MKILVANCHREIVGGAERYIRVVISRLREHGHDLAIVHKYPASPQAPRIDDPAHSIPAWETGTTGVGQLLKEIDQWSPDVVFGHGLETFEVEQELVSRYPYVAFTHDYSYTCPSGQKCTFQGNIRSCERIAGPACLLLHYPLRCGGLHPLRTLRDYRHQSQRAGLLSRYSAVLVASHHMERELARHGVNPERLHLLPLPPADLQPDPEPPVWRKPEGRLIVTGRLMRVKGAAYAISAVQLAAQQLGRTLELTVAGSGPELADLQKQAIRENVPVHFTGWVDTPQLASRMRNADLLVFPSLWPEPFGLVGIEAGCMGIPSAGYAIGGAADWLSGGETGEAAPVPPTPEGLAAAIVRALQDEAHYNHLRRGAWQMSQQYTLSRHMRLLEPVLKAAATGTQLRTAGVS